jgi:hypothetical protein
MMKNKQLVLFLMLLTFVLSACDGVPNVENNIVDAVEDAVATAIAATKTASAPAAIDPTDEPTENSTEVVVNPTEPAATQVTCNPIHPGNSQIIIPSGASLTLRAAQNQLNLFNFNGAALATLTLTDISWPNSDQIHLASSNNAPPANLPIIYHSLSTSGETLKLSQNSVSSDLYPAPHYITIAGQDGGNYIAYSTSGTGTTGGWSSELFAGDYQNAGNNPSIQIRDEGDGYVLFPLTIQSNNGQAVGIWFTESMWGIGNIIFAPWRGLFYYDLQTYSVTEFISSDNIIAGLSPDNSWVAYAHNPAGNNPGQAQSQLNLKNLITCQEVVLLFNPASNLGGGWVKFSPNNQYVAWVEASGNNPMEATTRIRIAKIDGTILVDALPNTLSGLIGGEVPNRVMPFKWVEDHILAVEVGKDGLNDPFFVIWAPDPAFPIDPVLGANQSVLIGSGIGMGFIYP